MQLFFIDFVIRFIEFVFCIAISIAVADTRCIIAKYVKSCIMFHSILRFGQDETYVFFFAPKRFRRCVHAWLKLGYFFKKKKKRASNTVANGNSKKRKMKLELKAGRSLFNFVPMAAPIAHGTTCSYRSLTLCYEVARCRLSSSPLLLTFEKPVEILENNSRRWNLIPIPI